MIYWIIWCPGEDSNFHDHNGHWHLKPARLPIPPPGLVLRMQCLNGKCTFAAIRAENTDKRLAVNPFVARFASAPLKLGRGQSFVLRQFSLFSWLCVPDKTNTTAKMANVRARHDGG